MAKSETLEFKVYREQVFGKDAEGKERGIVYENDWRDPDRIVRLPGLRVYVRDDVFRNHGGSIEPDWEQGWYLLDNSTSQVAFEGKGSPPDWVRTALHEGRVIYGVIILRDEQIHS